MKIEIYVGDARPTSVKFQAIASLTHTPCYRDGKLFQEFQLLTKDFQVVELN